LFAFYQKLISRIIRDGMYAGIHPDRVARASFHAETTEDAAQFVYHKADWVALVAATRVALGVLTRFDENALCRASG
jgi:hypothetical protein